MSFTRPTQFVSRSQEPDDRALAAWAVDVLKALRELQAVPFLDGARLDNVSIGTADTKIPHKLGRKPRGFWWINPSANTVVWQPQAPTDTHIHLQAGAAIITDIWVF